MLRSRSRTQADRRGLHGSSDHQWGASAPAAPAAEESSAAVPEISVSAPRAGVYFVTDRDGTQVGTVRGDYVIGFTARYFGLVRRFSDLDEAKSAIIAEYHQRRTGAANSDREPSEH